MTVDMGVSRQQIDDEHDRYLLDQPLTVRCAWCDWTHHTTAADAIDAARDHRHTVHGIKPKKGLSARKRRLFDPRHNGSLEQNIANARATGAATWASQ